MFSVEAAAEKGRELPTWFIEEPEVEPGDEFYLRAFRDLDTCRSSSMSIGPIPWRDIIYYAERSGLEEDLIEPFIRVIRLMDSAHREWVAKETEKGAKQ